MWRPVLTIGSHLAKYGVLVLIDPTFVSVAAAAGADGANAVSQGAENAVSTLWDISHDLVMDAQSSREADALAKRMEEVLAPIRKKYGRHWDLAETQLIAITGKRIPSAVEFSERLADRKGGLLLESFERTHPNLVQFKDQQGDRKACEEALSAWLGVLATDAAPIRSLGLLLATDSAKKLALLEKASKERPDLSEAIERAMQAWRDVEALDWLKVPKRKWRRRPDSSAILKADFGVVPLFGRDSELADLAGWLASGDPIAVRAVTGEGGTGKTRLSQEFVRKHSGTHFAGFISRSKGAPSRNEVAAMFVAAKRLGKPVLAVIDYADTQSGLVCDLLEEADKADAGLRLVLLTRNATDWKKQLSGDAASLVPADPAAIEMALLPIGFDRSDREAFFAMAVPAFAAASGKPQPEAIRMDEKAASDGDFDNALVLSIAALACAFGDDVTSQQAAFEWALRHERDGWRRHFAKEPRTEPEEAWLDAVSFIAAVTTMIGGASNRAALKAIAKAVLSILQREDLSDDGLADALASFYPNGKGGAAALEPDRIGEFHVDRLLRQQQAALAIASATAKATGDAFPLLRFFNRAVDWLDILTPEVAKGLYSHLPEQTMEFRDLAEKVTRAAMGEDASPEKEAAYLNDLSVRLSDLGRREEALGAAQRAVELREELAASRPDAFRPYLATSLNNLANRLSDLGRREEALGAAQRAVELREELAASRPDAFRPYLATSLNNLAAMLSALGRREEALGAAQRAVELREELAASRPDAFRPDLATSLNNLAGFLSDLGRREEALGAAQRAVDLYEELAASRPDAFAHDLATSISVRGDVLLALGRAAESAGAQLEALTTLMPILRRHPQAFAGLAMQIGRDYIGACEKAGIEADEAVLGEVLAILAEAGLIEVPAQEG